MDDFEERAQQLAVGAAYGMAGIAIVVALIKALRQDLLLSPEGVAAIFETAEGEFPDGALPAEIVRDAGLQALGQLPGQDAG